MKVGARQFIVDAAAASIARAANTVGEFERAIIFLKYLRKWEDTYFILQNKYLCIYNDSFGAKILRDECALHLIYQTKNNQI